MCHVFGVSTAIVTHIPRKMCHFCGVSTGLVTHIPLKMCHFFVGSGRRLQCLGEKGCRGFEGRRLGGGVGEGWEAWMEGLGPGLGEGPKLRAWKGSSR